jgi:MazG family protein
VFGAAGNLKPEEVKKLWSRIKDEERMVKGEAGDGAGTLQVPLALPALTRAEKLQQQAAKAGFDWKNTADIVRKIEEETREVEAALGSRDAEAEELGDLLFAVVNLARRLKIDPEEALRAGNRKFERRFRAIEAALAAKGRKPADATIEELETLWDDAKATERR